jgi:hypothetical protein
MGWIGIAQDITTDGLIPTASDSGQKPSLVAPAAPPPAASPATNRASPTSWAASPSWRRLQIGVSVVVFAVVGMILLSGRDRRRPRVEVRPYTTADAPHRPAPARDDRWSLPNEVPPVAKPGKAARASRAGAQRAARGPDSAGAAKPNVASRPETPRPDDATPSNDVPTLDQVRALERNF